MIADRLLTRNEFFTADQIRTVIEYARARRSLAPVVHRNYAVFCLATFCGCRATEILRLTLADLRIDADAPELVVRSLKKRGRKQSATRRVPVDLIAGVRDDLRAWLQVRLDMGATPSDPLVCTMRLTVLTPVARRAVGSSSSVGSPLSNRVAVNQAFRGACKPLWAPLVRDVAGPARNLLLHDYHTHRGRHTFGTELARRGFPLQNIQRWMGHSSIQTTMIYLHSVHDLSSADRRAF